MERFHPILETAKSAFIVDRYLGKQVWEHGTYRAKRRATGAEWFLSKLKKYDLERVFLATECPGECRIDDLQEATEALCGRIRPGFEVRLMPLYLSKWPVHARHVRLDEAVAIQLEKGMDTFTDARFTQNYPFHWLAVKDAIADYREIKSLSRHSPSGITVWP